MIATLLAVSVAYCINQAEAKGAIYLTTKNGTFPIMLTSFKSHDTAAEDAEILSAKNLTRQNWDDGAEMFSNYANDTYDYDTEVWKINRKRSINDAVSKNITMVLENLLKNYENSQLPTHGKGN
nr:uncharacterized protein LOC116766414 [Danaus plexippus plexippus]